MVRARNHHVGIGCLCLAIITLVLQSEIAHYLQSGYYKPYFVLYLSHVIYVMILPIQFLYFRYIKDTTTSLYETIALSASTLPTLSSHHHTTVYPIYRKLVLLTLSIFIVFTTASYSWYLAVSRIPLGDLTAIYNSSCFFAYILSLYLLHEQISCTKITSVLLSILGIMILSLWNTENVEQTVDWMGYLFALSSSFSYGLYEVVYRKYAVPHRPSSLFSLHMTGLLGCVNVVVGWLPLPLLHVTRVEEFVLPTLQEFKYILLNSLVGLCCNACLMLAISFLGPVKVAVGIMVTIPLTCLADYLLEGIPIGTRTLLGSGCILLGLILMYLPHQPEEQDNQEEEERPLLNNE